MGKTVQRLKVWKFSKTLSPNRHTATKQIINGVKVQPHFLTKEKILDNLKLFPCDTCHTFLLKFVRAREILFVMTSLDTSHACLKASEATLLFRGLSTGLADVRRYDTLKRASSTLSIQLQSRALRSHMCPLNTLNMRPQRRQGHQQQLQTCPQMRAFNALKRASSMLLSLPSNARLSNAFTG